jgi:hypothetical protein
MGGGQPRRIIIGLVTALLLAAPASAAAPPRYDVPPGFTRCPHVVAWHGFFKWVSVRHASCERAARVVSAYAARADGAPMPRRVGAYTGRIRYWRNADGDIYASRHVCTRCDVVIRFYGMV